LASSSHSKTCAKRRKCLPDLSRSQTEFLRPIRRFSVRIRARGTCQIASDITSSDHA
jgi:hypothetical protein